MTRQILPFLTLLFIVTSCQPTRNMVAVIKTDGKYGFINYNGKIIIPTTFDYARDFQEGLAPIEINGKTGYINLKGQLTIPTTYD
ncbi:MAG: WG repeat-containing protein, partial [Chitinophagaceae bacterium]